MKSNLQSRRKFIKTMTLSSTAAMLGFGGVFKIAEAAKLLQAEINFDYQYSSFSVKHLPEMKAWFEKLNDEKKISNQKTFRTYINFDFDPEKTLKGAKSVVVLSRPQKVEVARFSYEGSILEIKIPTGYLSGGLPIEDIEKVLLKDVIENESAKLVWSGLPLKTSAVRSGLAKYGKNNISYVNRYGSNHQLLGYYTDVELEDNWGPYTTLEDCRGCTICIDKCPTQCIPKDNKFVINAGECLTLYNEIADPFPVWLDAKHHHTVVGCLRCQYTCPGNKGVMKDIPILAELNESETKLIMSDNKDELIIKQIQEKMKRCYGIEDFNYFRRNVKAALLNII